MTRWDNVQRALTEVQQELELAIGWAEQKRARLLAGALMKIQGNVRVALEDIRHAPDEAPKYED